MYEEIFILAIIILLFAAYIFYRKYMSMKIEFKKLSFDKQSLSVKYGKITEQFLPFIKDYPYNEENFRFIGNPIDGVQFEQDKIIFVEFKAGDSRLTEKQKEIKKLVENKKVEFEEVRIS